jgi:hypothetical protein
MVIIYYMYVHRTTRSRARALPAAHEGLPGIRRRATYLMLHLLSAGCPGFQLAPPPHTQAQRLLLRRERSVQTQRTAPLRLRENYVPSWVSRGSGANNVYGEQQSEYEEYAKYLSARSGASDESVSATAAAPEAAEAAEAAAAAAAVPLGAEANEATSSPLLESSAPSTSEAEAEAAAAKAAWLARQGVASWNSQHRSEG